MGDHVFVDDDIARITIPGRKDKVMLFWGDAIEVLGRQGNKLEVRVRVGRTMRKGTVARSLKTRAKSVFQFSMPDVQQGDALVIETPEGRRILVDGGDNQLFARYLAARYPSSKDSPVDIDAIIVTHGDADHFDGLNKIRTTETDKKLDTDKRLFLRVKRVFHNGLVKGPSKLKAETIFGKTVKSGANRFAVDLVDDPRTVAATRMNTPFKRWAASLKHWAKRGEIDIRRLAFGDKREFDFLRAEGIEVEVLGPITRRVKVGRKTRAALQLLRTPPKTVDLILGEHDSEGSFSASHTVNGHSVTLRMTIGNVRFFLSGDHNQESMQLLREKVTPGKLRCEILKVPHHGSADFDLKTLFHHAPIVSLISSGDESSRKEHIHPRASLMAALGAASRSKMPLLFCTELAAFFEMRGMSRDFNKKKTYFGFERTNFGIIHIRTDGERVLVFTHSGKASMKEAYRFRVDANHDVKFEKIVKR